MRLVITPLTAEAQVFRTLSRYVVLSTLNNFLPSRYETALILTYVSFVGLMENLSSNFFSGMFSKILIILGWQDPSRPRNLGSSDFSLLGK